jgi:hypothetical protein
MRVNVEISYLWILSLTFIGKGLKYN